MPIYAYRCDEGHEFEAFQSMSDEPVSVCAQCGAPAKRLLSAPAIHFKGSGFYTTDYAKKRAPKKDGEKAAKTDAKSDSSSNGSGGSDTSGGSSSSESKAATGSGGSGSD